MLRRALISTLLLLACTPLVRPGQDAGSGGGAGGGSGGGTGAGGAGAWVEVPLALTGAQGDVQRLAARAGEVWAMVAHGAVLRATTGRFELLWDVTPPNLLDFALTPGGRAAVLTDGALLGCTSGCDAPAGYVVEVVTLPRSRAVCSGGEALVYLVGLADGGTALFDFDGAQWNRAEDVPVREARQCAVDTAGRVYVGGRGAVGLAADGGVDLIAPATGALARLPGDELWTLVAADSVAFAASAQGAGVRGDAWSALPALAGAAAALAVRSPTQAAVFGTGTAARFDGTAWRPDVAPAALASITAATYGTDGALYVGGSDATGAPRIFRRAP